MAEYFLDLSKSKQIEAEMAKVPERSEDAVNNVLRTVGVKEAIQDIIKFIPVSDRNKKHAKSSNPLKSTTQNLGFKITTKGGATGKNGFGYLVFPNDGLGEHNPIAQKFFETGGDVASNFIFDAVMKALGEAMELK